MGPLLVQHLPRYPVSRAVHPGVRHHVAPLQGLPVRVGVVGEAQAGPHVAPYVLHPALDLALGLCQPYRTPEEQKLPGKHLMTLKKGDLYRVIQAGAGGYDNPLHRDPQAVLEDIQQQKLTPAHVHQEYGVVTDSTGNLDLPATQSLRTKLSAD